MSAGLAAEAAACWNATPVRLIRDRENAVYEIRLADGARAALRLHRVGYQSEAAIRSELWLCAALAGKGVAVPAALEAAGGDLLVRLSTGRLASVVAWCEGEPLGEARVPFTAPLATLLPQFHALGRLVRQVQEATASLDLPDWFDRHRWDRDGLVGDAPTWGRFWDHPGADARQRDVLLQARAYLAQHLSGPVLPIHADVLRENVLAQGTALSLIDFDDSGWGYPLYDLGTCMSQNLYEPAADDLRAALMQGYGTEDREGVERMTLARCCASVGWTMPRLAPDEPVVSRHIERAVMLARRVMG